MLKSDYGLLPSEVINTKNGLNILDKGIARIFSVSVDDIRDDIANPSSSLYDYLKNFYAIDEIDGWYTNHYVSFPPSAVFIISHYFGYVCGNSYAKEYSEMYLFYLYYRRTFTLNQIADMVNVMVSNLTFNKGLEMPRLTGEMLNYAYHHVTLSDADADDFYFHQNAKWGNWLRINWKHPISLAVNLMRLARDWNHHIDLPGFNSGLSIEEVIALWSELGLY